MASEGKGGKPWDAALGAVSKQLDDASKSVREAASGPVNQARETVLSEVEQAKELTSSTRVAISKASQQAWESVQTAVAPVVAVFKQAEGDEGTPLRKYIGTARVQVNQQLYEAQMALESAKKTADAQMGPVRSGLVIAQKQLVKANEFRREHPEVAAAGVVVAVGVPSLLLRGKWSAARNSVLALGGAAAGCYGADKWDEKKRK